MSVLSKFAAVVGGFYVSQSLLSSSINFVSAAEADEQAVEAGVETVAEAAAAASTTAEDVDVVKGGEVEQQKEDDAQSTASTEADDSASTSQEDKEEDEDDLDDLDKEEEALSEDAALDKVRDLLKRIMNNENVEDDPNLDMEKLLEGIDQEKLHALFSEMMPPELLQGLGGEEGGEMPDMDGMGMDGMMDGMGMPEEGEFDDSEAALDAMDDDDEDAAEATPTTTTGEQDADEEDL